MQTYISTVDRDVTKNSNRRRDEEVVYYIPECDLGVANATGECNTIVYRISSSESVTSPSADDGNRRDNDGDDFDELPFADIQTKLRLGKLDSA